MRRIDIIDAGGGRNATHRNVSPAMRRIDIIDAGGGRNATHRTLVVGGLQCWSKKRDVILTAGKNLSVGRSDSVRSGEMLHIRSA